MTPAAAGAERAAIAALAESLEPARGVDGVVVLGSGLGEFVDGLQLDARLAFAELPAMPKSGVPGHAGFFAVARHGDVRVLVQSGRVHRYEGRTPLEVARSVRAAAALGACWCLLTNAAGGLHARWRPGTLMAIRDHLDLQGGTPLFAGEGGWGRPYAEAGRAALERAARAAGVDLETGVYAGGLGPAYETPAEVRLAGALGADAVGMSTVAEAAAARAAGLLVAGVSCVTNAAAGVTDRPLSHAEVLAAGREAAPRFAALLGRALDELPAAAGG